MCPRKPCPTTTPAYCRSQRQRTGPQNALPMLEQHGHHCDTALLADMPQAHEEVGRFVQKHRLDVVIYAVGMPYASSWDCWR